MGALIATGSAGVQHVPGQRSRSVHSGSSGTQIWPSGQGAILNPQLCWAAAAVTIAVARQSRDNRTMMIVAAGAGTPFRMRACALIMNDKYGYVRMENAVVS